MSKKPTPAPTPGANTLTLKLSAPIKDRETGKSWDALTLQPPALAHRILVERRRAASDTERTVEMIALLSGVPVAAVRQIKTRDARKAVAWMDAPAKEAVAADTIADVVALLGDGGSIETAPLEYVREIIVAAASDVPPVCAAIVANARARWAAAAQEERAAVKDREVPWPLDAARTFRLCVPLVIEGEPQPITEITLREPDLEAGIAVERLRDAGEGQATAAMLAALSGHTIPVVQRLAIADVTRMERWLGFFSDAGAG